MDALTDKSYLEYENLSRYAQFPYYYNKYDEKYMMGTTAWLNDDVEYVLVKVKPTDTLMSLSNDYYGRPDYFWVIADFNRILDVFENLIDYHTTIKIPSISQITFKN